MNNCKHVFIGSAEGIKCRKCGLTMSAREYAEYLALIKSNDKKQIKSFEENPSELVGKQKKPQRKTAGKGGKA